MSEWDFAFELTGQALEDALSSGATYEEWDIIERELEREITVGNHGKNVFAFIDAENVPSKYWEQIEYRMSCLVDNWSGKVYALQKDHATMSWHEVAKANDCLKEIRLSGGPAKNKVDKKIIRDIRRLIGDCVPAETCVFIVSSDSDYRVVVTELKEAGVRVIGIGEAKANANYKQSFDSFIEMGESDVYDIDESDDVDESSSAPLPSWFVGGSDAYRYGMTT
ncbi:MAG: NYN domain-containing protein [Kiritimatiellae bacterium]|nr:NYN domain-containing protein [Kiritimatiellia bacterium]